MSDAKPTCPQCSRKIMQSVSNRCMYCGASLPEEHHLTAEEKNQPLKEKLEMFKRNEENAEEIISGMRKGMGIPERKKPKQKKSDSAQRVEDALADISNHLEELKRQRDSKN